MKQEFLKRYDRHVDAIYRYCYRMTKDKATSLALTEQTFKNVWDDWESLKEVAEIDTTLHAIARRLVREHTSKTMKLLHNLSLKFS
jgi:DNA-directed RNA polymerase specialized sigma24 family protein